jgi:hypothetical protein
MIFGSNGRLFEVGKFIPCGVNILWKILDEVLIFP